MNTSYKGRVLGFILGFIFTNLLGAILFMILGYLFFDRPANLKKQQNDEAVRAFTSNANYNESLVKVTFALMGYVARGAGRVNESHIEKSSQIMNVMGLNAQMRKTAIDAFNSGKSENFNLNDTISEIKSLIGNNFSFVNFILEIQVQLALSDGVLEDEEYRRLMDIAVKLGASRDSMEQYIRSRYNEMHFEQQFRDFYRSRYERENTGSGYDYSRSDSSYDNSSSSYSGSGFGSSKLDSAYKILGVESSASDDEIKKAHKRLMLKYHPDRLASQGLTPEMIKLYTEKAKDIQAAFDLIKKERGF
ncbi:DnaJ like chaperone protein [Succinivibrio dextrinosolvens DSM 3072]|uniref:DnaJ like chaperone protein n=1 Tax=Succinivibrio dextrinosolvens DSM 3072 TaxID=1123324 RepID=A0A1T4VG92_9GAMM|nr:co-chaperone DjlA [Succinivibrio dextrinosolvens]SKA63954.1 DnaJ like chaperone protein [Succinivibrio dextrinosolvens DSM 3072]